MALCSGAVVSRVIREHLQLTELGLDTGKQQSRHTSAVPRWANRHPTNVAFPLVDDIAGDSANDLAGNIYRNEHGHRCQTTTEAFGC